MTRWCLRAAPAAGAAEATSASARTSSARNGARRARDLSTGSCMASPLGRAGAPLAPVGVTDRRRGSFREMPPTEPLPHAPPNARLLRTSWLLHVAVRAGGHGLPEP